MVGWGREPEFPLGGAEGLEQKLDGARSGGLEVDEEGKGGGQAVEHLELWPERGFFIGERDGLEPPLSGRWSVLDLLEAKKRAAWGRRSRIRLVPKVRFPDSAQKVVSMLAVASSSTFR